MSQSTGITDESSNEGLSIGALSRATGISIHSLRMWERRYGAPESIRRDSGHRRYPFSEVNRLRAVARALATGLRASQVVSANIEEIDILVEKRQKSTKGRKRAVAAVESNRSIDEKMNAWIEAAKQFDENLLGEEFRRDWDNMGYMRFLNDRVVPFIKRMGELWQCGEIAIASEHFATERLCDFLAGQWRFRNVRLIGKPFVLATLPKDVHRIGLHLAAVISVMRSQRIVFLGAEVPSEEIVAVTKTVDASGVCLSISATTASRFSNRTISDLAGALPNGIELICGGSGAPTRHSEATIFNTLTAYDEWLYGRQSAKQTQARHL